MRLPATRLEMAETKKPSPSQAESVQQKSASAGPTHRRVVRGKGAFRDVVLNNNTTTHAPGDVCLDGWIDGYLVTRRSTRRRSRIVAKHGERVEIGRRRRTVRSNFTRTTFDGQNRDFGGVCLFN